VGLRFLYKLSVKIIRERKKYQKLKSQEKKVNDGNQRREIQKNIEKVKIM
jgi:hypothetical protein